MKCLYNWVVSWVFSLFWWWSVCRFVWIGIDCKLSFYLLHSWFLRSKVDLELHEELCWESDQDPVALTICGCSQVRNRLEDLVTNLQSSKMTLEEQLSREVNFDKRVTLSFELHKNAMEEERIDWENISLFIVSPIYYYSFYSYLKLFFFWLILILEKGLVILSIKKWYFSFKLMSIFISF